MTTLLLMGRFLAAYGRRPINLALLIAVPVVFVGLSSGAIADFALIVGGRADTRDLTSVTAGWAAAFLAGVSGFFHVFDSRQADRRLAGAGMSSTRITAARLASGLLLALLASGAALAALALQTGMADPSRAVSGTLMFAFIYLAIGVTVGAVVRSDVNGSLVVIFIWMTDVFLGPAMAGGDILITRLFPSHFVTLVMLDAGSTDGSSVSDVIWAMAWTMGAIAVAATVFASSTATSGPHKASRWESRLAGPKRVADGIRYGLREYRRNLAMWAMLVVLPIFFISLSFYITPDAPAPIEVTEDGVASIAIVSMIDVHGALMVPITIGFLAGLAGLFVVQGSLQADARLSLAGFGAREILASRLGIIAVAALLVTGVSLAVTAIDFVPQGWTWFALGNALVAATYGLLGVLVGALFGRLGGLYVMFLVPFIDVGLAQNVMFSAAPPDWGLLLPARGAVRVLIDAAFTPTFDLVGDLMLAILWLLGLVVAAAILFQRIAAPKRI